MLDDDVRLVVKEIFCLNVIFDDCNKILDVWIVGGFSLKVVRVWLWFCLINDW